jgi:ABC-type Fe3+ transport system permease subunit
MLATPGNQTIAVIMYHYWERKADFSLASTLGVVMLLFIGVLTFFSRRMIAHGFTREQ